MTRRLTRDGLSRESDRHHVVIVPPDFVVDAPAGCRLLHFQGQ
jgi:hypothetical protein